MNNLESEARRRARETREAAGISPVSPLDVWKLLQTAGVSLIKEPLKGQISGLFLRYEDEGLILINSTRSLGHQNFTAAHEYFHLEYNREITGRACLAGRFDHRTPVERQADCFAAHLLAPDEAIEFQIQRRRHWLARKEELDFGDVIALEQLFGLSHQAMLIRLKETEWLSEEVAARMKEGIVSIARSLGYNTELYRPTGEFLVLSDYAAKAKAALDRGLISNGRYEELLLEAGLGDVLYGEEEGEGQDAANFI